MVGVAPERLGRLGLGGGSAATGAGQDPAALWPAGEARFYVMTPTQVARGQGLVSPA